jgi:hypothetical protein
VREGASSSYLAENRSARRRRGVCLRESESTVPIPNVEGWWPGGKPVGSHRENSVVERTFRNGLFLRGSVVKSESSERPRRRIQRQRAYSGPGSVRQMASDHIWYARTMHAQLHTRIRQQFPDGSILSIVIWLLPETDAGRPHRYKYSLIHVVMAPLWCLMTTNGPKEITSTSGKHKPTMNLRVWRNWSVIFSLTSERTEGSYEEDIANFH